MAEVDDFLVDADESDASDWSLVEDDEAFEFDGHSSDQSDAEMEEGFEATDFAESADGDDVEMDDEAIGGGAAGGVISAEALLARAYEKQKKAVEHLPAVTEQSVTASYDLGHLSCFAPISLSFGDEKDGGAREKALREAAEVHTQALVNELFRLPNKPDQDFSGLVARLPPPRTGLPREKPVPKAKALTRWQKFALRKGIRKKRKNREWLAWDEDAGEFKKKWGWDRANDPLKTPLVEHADHDFEGKQLRSDLMADPFTKMKKEKRKRIIENETNRRMNIAEARGDRVPGTVDLQSAVLSARMRKTGASAHESRRLTKQLSKVKAKKYGHLDTALGVAQHSTGSMGKFDRRVKHEPAPTLKRNVKSSVDYMQPHKLHDRKKHGRDKGSGKIRDAERKKQSEILFQVFGKEQKDAFDAKQAGKKVRQEIVYKHKRTKHRSGKKGR